MSDIYEKWRNFLSEQEAEEENSLSTQIQSSLQNAKYFHASGREIDGDFFSSSPMSEGTVEDYVYMKSRNEILPMYDKCKEVFQGDDEVFTASDVVKEIFQGHVLYAIGEKRGEYDSTMIDSYFRMVRPNFANEMAFIGDAYLTLMKDIKLIDLVVSLEIFTSNNVATTRDPEKFDPNRASEIPYVRQWHNTCKKFTSILNSISYGNRGAVPDSRNEKFRFINNVYEYFIYPIISPNIPTDSSGRRLNRNINMSNMTMAETYIAMHQDGTLLIKDEKIYNFIKNAYEIQKRYKSFFINEETDAPRYTKEDFIKANAMLKDMMKQPDLINRRIYRGMLLEVESLREEAKKIYHLFRIPQEPEEITDEATLERIAEISENIEIRQNQLNGEMNSLRELHAERLKLKEKFALAKKDSLQYKKDPVFVNFIKDRDNIEDLYIETEEYIKANGSIPKEVVHEIANKHYLLYIDDLIIQTTRQMQGVHGEVTSLTDKIDSLKQELEELKKTNAYTSKEEAEETAKYVLEVLLEQEYNFNDIYSWSYDRDIAESFSINNFNDAIDDEPSKAYIPVLFKVDKPNQGVYIKNFSHFPDEEEFISGGVFKPYTGKISYHRLKSVGAYMIELTAETIGDDEG